MIFLSRYLGYKGVLTLHPKLDADLLKERKAFDVDESKRAEKCKQERTEWVLSDHLRESVLTQN